jgi:flagellar hook-length control protein FliK
MGDITVFRRYYSPSLCHAKHALLSRHWQQQGLTAERPQSQQQHEQQQQQLLPYRSRRQQNTHHNQENQRQRLSICSAQLPQQLVAGAAGML